MLSYLAKFNSLPSGLKQKVSSQASIAAIDKLENKYGLPLAALVMKVLVREVALEDLEKYFTTEKLNSRTAGELSRELRENIFKPLGDFLSADVPSVEAASAGASQAAVQSKADNEPQVKSAGFFFSPDDEAEIRELTKKIDQADKPEIPVATVEEKLQTVVDRAQINFGSAELADRFRQIVKIYLRGIRNKLETKQTLIKPFSNGGLSFDDESAQKVMDLADKILNSSAVESIKPLPKINIPLSAAEAPYDFSKFAKDKPASAAPAGETAEKFQASQIETDLKKIKEKLPEKPELAPLTPVPQKAPAPTFKAPAKAPVKVTVPAASKIEIKPKKAPETMTANLPPVRPKPRPETAPFNQKIRVEDVKYIPRVMSPLDELKYLDLVNFRRLDKDAVRATNKIKEKIDLLGDESYAKRLEGIKCWRSSPVNRLYLELGHLSISKNRPVDVIIEERKMAEEDYLTSDEFKAVMDLNKILRF